MNFEDRFGFKCGICESIWNLGSLNEGAIRFGHVIFCGASESELDWLEGLEWPEESEDGESE